MFNVSRAFCTFSNHWI